MILNQRTTIILMCDATLAKLTWQYLSVEAPFEKQLLLHFFSSMIYTISSNDKFAWFMFALKCKLGKKFWIFCKSGKFFWVKLSGEHEDITLRLQLYYL